MNVREAKCFAKRLARDTDGPRINRGPGDIRRALNIPIGRYVRAVCKDEELSLTRVGPHFRDHLLLDEQAEQIFATIDVIAERAGKGA